MHVLVSVQHVTVCQSSSVPLKWTNGHNLAEYSQGFSTVTAETDSIMTSQPQCPEEIIGGDIMDSMLVNVLTMAVFLVT